MSNADEEKFGRLTDEERAAEQSDDDGAAAEGEYDATQGSPGEEHPVGDAFPEERHDRA